MAALLRQWILTLKNFTLTTTRSFVYSYRLNSLINRGKGLNRLGLLHTIQQLINKEIVRIHTIANTRDLYTCYSCRISSITGRVPSTTTPY